MQETLIRFLGWEDTLKKDRLPTLVFLGFSGGSAGKESNCNAGDHYLIPRLGRFPGEGNGYPLQYSGLENSMDSIVHGVTKSWTRVSNFHFTSLHFTSIHFASLYFSMQVGLAGSLHTPPDHQHHRNWWYFPSVPIHSLTSLPYLLSPALQTC